MTEPEEQQRLLAHRRAMTEALPDEMNPVAVGQHQGVSGVSFAQSALPSKVITFPSREVVAECTILTS